MGDELIYYRRRLPHYQPLRGTFFVTFRLAGSLPDYVVLQLKKEHLGLERQIAHMRDDSERNLAREEARKQYFENFDRFLDTSAEGQFWLRDDRIAGLVSAAIKYRDQMAYELLAYCIMPNHVHMVFSVERFAESLPARDGVSRYIVTDIIGSLKKFTAHEANKILYRSGIFWQHESYDHVVRNDGDLGRIIEYVLNNPVKAGMVQEWTKWKWSYCNVPL